MDIGDVASPSAWCLGAPVPRSPRGARTPSTIDRRATGPPVHTTRARRAVRFRARRDAAHRGPLEASVTDLRTDFGADEGSARKIPDGSHEPSNHDLSASSRNASRRDSSFAHRHPSIASRRTRGAIVRFRENLGGRPGPAWGTRSGAGKTEGKENGGRPPPFPVSAPRPIVGLPRCGAVRMVAGHPGGPAIGNPPHRAISSSGRRHRASVDRYTPRVPHRVEAAREQGYSLGGPAIARSGRVVRPVRRPSDRQSPRRNASGDPREICNHSDPSLEARVELIPEASR